MKEETTMPKIWYENKRFVSALLVAFFPAGLYGLWKSTQFSSRTKGIVIGLVVLPILIGFFHAAHRESRFVTADASIPKKSHDAIQRMGVSYRQATDYLRDFMAMEPGAPVNGQSRYRGTSKDYTISLEIIGDRNAITEAKMIIVQSRAVDIEKRNRALLHRFLTNLVPEWPSSSDWADATLDRFSAFQDETVSAMRGYKKVTVTQMQSSGTITVVVKHA
jgi:hypothetical protein